MSFVLPPREDLFQSKGVIWVPGKYAHAYMHIQGVSVHTLEVKFWLVLWMVNE